MSKSTLKCLSRVSVFILCILGIIELGLALWTVLDYRYKTLAYHLADVGYIDLWILRYLSLCLFASSIITLVMCLILIWGLYSAHVLLFIASTMIALIVVCEFIVSMLTFTSKHTTRITLMEQLPKLVTTYRNGNDERARRALEILQINFHCCGVEGRLSYRNHVPPSCHMYSVGCLSRTMFFLDSWMDALSYVLLFSSILKLFIIVYFYSFLCLNYQYRQKRLRKTNHDTHNDSSVWHHSSSFESSTDNLSKRNPIPSTRKNHDENENSGQEYMDSQRVLLDDYDSSTSPNKQVYTTTIISPSSWDNNGLTTSYEPTHVSRKLSSISERTERTETDESEPDSSRLKFHKAKRNVILSNQNYNSPPKIKNRRMIVREDDHDSGVEYSSSEKSSEDQRQQPKTKSTSSLGLSKVFVTSFSHNQIIDDEVRKPLTTSDAVYSNEIKLPPKPILKNSNQQSPSMYRNQKFISPAPIPRSTLKQLYQDESLH